MLENISESAHLQVHKLGFGGTYKLARIIVSLVSICLTGSKGGLYYIVERVVIWIQLSSILHMGTFLCED